MGSSRIEQPRAVHERLDQPDFLFVAVRVVAEPARGVEIEPRDQRVEIRAIDAAAKVGEVSENLAAREVGIERELAGQIAHHALDVHRSPPAVQARDARAAGVRKEQRHQQPHRRRLARAVRTEEAEHLALGHLERHIDDAALTAVPLREPGDVDERRHPDPFTTRRGGIIESIMFHLLESEIRDRSRSFKIG